MPITRLLWRHGRKVYLPSIQPGQQLCFKPYQPASRMTANQYQIDEPISDQGSRTAAALDLLIIPLVGFDRTGNRLGMGGGYYDRHLAYRTSRLKPGPLLVGLAYEFQRQPRLASDRWDIPLDLIVSERQVYDARPYSRKRR